MADPTTSDTYELFGRVLEGQIHHVQFIADIMHTALMAGTAGKQISVMGVMIGVGMVLRVLAEAHAGWSSDKFIQFMSDLSRYFDEHHVKLPTSIKENPDFAAIFPSKKGETQH